MKLSEKQWNFLQDVAKLINFADSLGYKLTAGEAWRSEYQQAKYLKDGKSQVDVSQHQKRLAMDFNLFINDKVQWHNNEHWKRLGDYWKSLSSENRWGGDYDTLSDPFHFEKLG